MAETIQDITVRISVETSGLNKALSGIKKLSKDIQDEFKKVESLPKFSQGGQFASKMEEVGESFKKIGSKFQNVGQSLSAKVIEPLTKVFNRVTAGTKEFRQEIAKLTTNAQIAGTGMNEIHLAMKQMQGITGELDSNVEGISNLLAAGFKGDQFKQVLDELSGAAIKFGNTLNFEEMAAGLQETLATGQAAGPFAELLERSGIALNDFNAGLQKAIADGTEENYVLQTLASTGLANVYDQYQKNNEELVKSAESQYDLQLALAGLGQTLEPVITKLTQLATGIASAFNNLSPAGQGIIMTMTAMAAAIGSVTLGFENIQKGIGLLISGIKNLPAMLGNLKAALAGVSMSTIGTVAGIAALAVIAVEVYRNWDNVKSALLAMWELIKASAVQLGLKIAIAFEEMKNNVLVAVNGILEKLGVLEKIPFGVGEKFVGLKDNISDSADQSADKIDQLKKAAEENAKNIQIAVEGTKVAFSGLGQAIANDVKGVISAFQGQTAVIKEQAETVTSEEKKKTNTVSQEMKNRIQLWNEEARKRNEAHKQAREAEIQQDEEAARKIQERLENRLSYEKQWNQRQQDQENQYRLAKAQSLEEEIAIKLELLEEAKNAELAKAEGMKAEQFAIEKYYNLEEQKILDQKAEAYELAGTKAANSFINFVEVVGSGAKTLKEAIKDMIINMISNLQKSILANTFTAEAIAYAMSLATFGASLGHLATLAAKVMPKIAILEALKAGIRELAQGGKVTAPTMALIGEGRDNEAVIPLNRKVFTELGRNIAANLPQTGEGRVINFHFHIGTLIGDEHGYRQLARKVFSYQIAERKRLGLGEVGV